MRKLVALLVLSYRFTVTINGLWLSLTVPWVGLQCVILVFSDHTHILFVGQRFLIFQLLNMSLLMVAMDTYMK